jgi:hypothetical protein
MPTVEGSVVIKASSAALFALSQDYALRRRWDPFVRDMRFLNGATQAGKGVHVWLRPRPPLRRYHGTANVRRSLRLAPPPTTRRHSRRRPGGCVGVGRLNQFG